MFLADGFFLFFLRTTYSIVIKTGNLKDACYGSTNYNDLKTTKPGDYLSKANAGDPNKWTVMTIQWNSSSVDRSSFWVNGKKIGSNFDSSKLKINNTFNPIIGAFDTNNTSSFNGDIAKVVIYNNLGNPTDDNDAVNKKYVNDNFLKTSDGAITGGLDIQSDIDTNGKQINDLAAPTGQYDACTKKYADDELAKKKITFRQ